MTYQRDFQQKLRVGIVGVGSHAYRNLLPAMNFLPVTLAAICDTNLDLARKTATQYGVPACYEDAGEMYREAGLDAVFLCVSPVMHPQLACDALDAGLHVWIENHPRGVLQRSRKSSGAAATGWSWSGSKKPSCRRRGKSSASLAMVLPGHCAASWPSTR